MHRAFIEPRSGGIQAEDRDDETRIASTLRRQELGEPQHALAVAEKANAGTRSGDRGGINVSVATIAGFTVDRNHSEASVRPGAARPDALMAGSNESCARQLLDHCTR
jgi:hypothetical protein